MGPGAAVGEEDVAMGLVLEGQVTVMCLASSFTLQIGLSFCPKGECVCVWGEDGD